jgi:hypothetical protein
VPLPPAVIVIQEALLEALQAQPGVAVRPMLPVPPLEENEALFGEQE